MTRRVEDHNVERVGVEALQCGFDAGRAQPDAARRNAVQPQVRIRILDRLRVFLDRRDVVTPLCQRQGEEPAA
jgi:hypothetical protein